MNNQDKIKYYRHILTMLDGGGNNDEINSLMCKTQGWSTVQALIYTATNYATSIDACKSIEEDGWLLNIVQEGPDSNNPNKKVGFKACYHKWEYGEHKSIVQVSSPKFMKTEYLARLYAIILTKIWRLENE